LLIMVFNGLIFRYGQNHLVKPLRRCLLKSGGNVAVGIKCHCYCSMAKPFLHYLGVHTLLEHYRGMGMSGVMKAYTL